MMIMTAGVNAAQMTLFFYLPDISLWLVIASILSIIEAVLKFRWMKVRPEADVPSTSFTNH